MKPKPLSDEQINKLIQNGNQKYVDFFDLVKTIVIDDAPMANDDDSSIKFSQMSYDEKCELLEGGIVDGFNIQISFKNCILFRKLNLIWLNDYFFELLESNRSGDVITIRDGKGTIHEYEMTKTGSKKIKMAKTKRVPPKPCKTKDGQDALHHLYRS